MDPGLQAHGDGLRSHRSGDLGMTLPLGLEGRGGEQRSKATPPGLWRMRESQVRRTKMESTGKAYGQRFGWASAD